MRYPTDDILRPSSDLGQLCPDGLCVLRAPFGQCEEMPNPEKCVYVAFLENPVDRVIGLYSVRCSIFAASFFGDMNCLSMDIVR